MKREMGFGVVGIIMIAFVIFVLRILNPSGLQELNEDGSQVLGTPAEFEQIVTLNSNGDEVTAAYFEVMDSSKLFLYDNLTEKNTASESLEAHSCQLLVNGGFYDVDDTHLGYIKTSDGVEEVKVKADLIDGFLTINSFGTPRVSPDLFEDVVIGVQTGPVIFENGSPVEIRMKRDKNARRMLAAVTGENNLVFIALYDAETTFFGPLMADLPKLVDELSVRAGLNIADAINLDGGSASAFLLPNFSLTESSTIGSYFCAR